MDVGEMAANMPANLTVKLVHENVPAPQQEEPAPPPPPKDDRFYKFWDKLTNKKPRPKRSATASLDRDVENYPGHHPQRNQAGIAVRENAVTSYEEAAASCRSKVEAIVEECRRINEKYDDPLFDMSAYNEDVLRSLDPSDSIWPSSCGESSGVGAMKRVDDIFEEPQFMIDGATANDVRQGGIGDCWFLAAMTALSGTEEPSQPLQLIRRLCVARDEEAGVYGFVFCRDGEWVSTVIDDRLFLKDDDDKSHYRIHLTNNKSLFEAMEAGELGIEELPKNVKDKLQKSSDALYFASCRDSNETWLPLIEKAYAKAHGDYQAIEGGYVGEGIEDLTGGVTSFLKSENILDKNKLWDELKRVNTDFLFGCHSRLGRDDNPPDDQGVVRGHAYTLLEAREYQGNKLLKIRNPWGTQEWNGAWSDGSKEWTAEAMKELNHTFGDDGIFWISLKDMLRHYPTIDRTRLFGPEWTVIQQYTAVNVPWMVDYLDTKFVLNISQTGPAVIVLAQPDRRYFKGLEGRYKFYLHFRLYKAGRLAYVLRSKNETGSGRSCSAEANLEPGTYYVHLKIEAVRTDEAFTAEEAIRRLRLTKKHKLLSVGTSFDVTHSKGLLRETENANKTLLKRSTAERDSQANVIRRNYNREERRRARLRRYRIKDEKERKKAEKKAKRAAAAGQGSESVEVTAEEGTASKVLIAEEEQLTEAQEPTPPPEEGGTESSTNGEPVVVEVEVAQEAEDGEQGSAGEVAPVIEEVIKEVIEEETPLGQSISDEEDESEMEDDDFSWDEMDDPVEVPELEQPDDIFEDDPWNAVCVVGLRLYSKDPEAQITIENSLLR